MDVILKETREAKSGQARPLDEFLKYKRQLATSSNGKIIINRPCIDIGFCFILNLPNLRLKIVEGPRIALEEI